ncbi:MAG: A24 family peptidase [Candidatus Ozemobacteraceae bacterium]
MLTTTVLAILGGIAGWFAGPRIGWAIRSWPGHESFEHDYLDCAKCPGGIKRRCYNAGAAQDKIFTVFSTVMGALSLALWGLSTKALLSWVFSVSCLVITVVDIRYLIIPDTLSVKGAWAGLLYSLTASLWVDYLGGVQPMHYVPIRDSVIGFMIGGGFLWMLGWLAWVILKKEGMGGGDVKLLAAIGAWMGWQPVIATVIIASLLGSIGGVTGILYQRIRYKKAYRPLTHLIPFGPYLCIGFLIVFYGGMTPLWGILEAYQRWVEGRFLPGN